MDEKALMEALNEGRVFKVGNSYIFAMQVPDTEVGLSGSRCSNCGCSTAFIDQICRSCNMPFVGPTDIQWSYWKALAPGEKRRMAHSEYNHPAHGRLGYANVENIPLCSQELARVERLGHKEAEHFEIAHGVSVQEMRRILKT